MTKSLWLLFTLGLTTTLSAQAAIVSCDGVLDSGKSSNIIEFRRKTPDAKKTSETPELMVTSPLDAYLSFNIKYLKAMNLRVSSDQLVKASTQNEIWRDYNNWNFFKHDFETNDTQDLMKDANPALVREFTQQLQEVQENLERNHSWQRISDSGRTLTPSARDRIKDPLPEWAQARFQELNAETRETRRRLLAVQRDASDSQLAQTLDQTALDLQKQISFLQQLRSKNDLAQIDIELVQELNAEMEKVLQLPAMDFLITKVEASPDTSLRISAENIRALQKQAQIIFNIYKNPTVRSLGLVK